MSYRAMVIVLDSAGCGGALMPMFMGIWVADTLGYLFAGIPGYSLPPDRDLGG